MNALLLAFGDGPERLPAERRATLTGLEAWNLSKQDQSAFSAVVSIISEETIQRLKPTPEALEIFSKDLQDYIVRYHLNPLQVVIETALTRAQEGKRFNSHEVHIIDPAASKEFDPLPAELLAPYNAQRICKDHSRVCHAASTSMFFGRNGWASACCVRRQPPYGTWPEKSISEIWFGDERKHLDEALAQNILPHGCDVCSDQVLAGNFRGTVAASHDYVVKDAESKIVPEPDQFWLRKLISGRRSGAAQTKYKPPVYPLKLAFELSNKCNLECEMCSGEFSSLIRANREGKAPLAQVYDERFVEQLREFIPHLQQADFRGGEPFLIDLYYQIWDMLIELNPTCAVTITTNGTALSPKIKQILEKLSFHLIISLDSL